MADQLKSQWLHFSQKDLKTELRQLNEEGLDTSPLKNEFSKLMSLSPDALFLPKNQAKAELLLDKRVTLKVRKGYAFKEPSDLAGIQKARGRGPRRFTKRFSDARMKDLFLGAWLGRCADCLLGKPIECIKTKEL